MQGRFALFALLFPVLAHAQDWNPLREFQLPPSLGDKISNTAAPVQAPAAGKALDPADEARLDLLERVAAAASQAWPGYDFWSVPFLMVQHGRSAVLIGHPAPPPSFSRSSRPGRPVYATTSPPDLGFDFRLDFPMWGAKVAAVEYDASDPPEKPIELAIHERFHYFQRGWAVAPFASYGRAQAEDVALAVMEQRALIDALCGQAGAMWRFVAIRTSRDHKFGKAATERSEESSEGTANYVERKAMDKAVGRNRGLEVLLQQLGAEVTPEAMAKLRFYGTGAAIGWWLDDHGVAWQAAVQAGRGPFDVLAADVPCRLADAESYVARLERSPGYRKALKAARRDVDADLQKEREAVRRFRSLPGLRVILNLRRGSDANLNVGSRGWIELDEGDLFDPLIVYVGQSTGWDFRIEDRMLLEARDPENVILEFAVAEAATIRVDARLWDGRPGVRAFSTLVLSEPGAAATVRNGTLEYDGKTLTIRSP